MDDPTGLPAISRLRFGVLLSPPAPREPVLEMARRAEVLGYDAFYMPDHFNDVLSPVPALAAVASVTSLRVGAYMLANDLRHPAMAARDFATLDVLSEGRAELGIGAGWWPRDYHAVGREMDRPSDRISRVREAVHLIRSCWTDDEVHHEGRWYRARLVPAVRPVQRPHPPIIVGGGRPKILSVAAEVADVVSIGTSLASGRRRDMAASNAAAVFEDLAAKVRTARRDSRRNALIDIMPFRVVIGRRSSEVIESVAEEHGVAPDQVRRSPQFQVGTLEEVVAGFERLARLGVGSFVIRSADLEAGAQVRTELLA